MRLSSLPCKRRVLRTVSSTTGELVATARYSARRSRRTVSRVMSPSPGGMSMTSMSRSPQRVMASSSISALVTSEPRNGAGVSPEKQVTDMNATSCTGRGSIPNSSSGKCVSHPRITWSLGEVRSRSSRPVRRPSPARVRARVEATMLLPIPPLPPVTASIRFTPRSRSSMTASRGSTRHLPSIVTTGDDTSIEVPSTRRAAPTDRVRYRVRVGDAAVLEQRGEGAQVVA